MKIIKTQSSQPIFEGETWVTKKDHGIELREKRSAGADKRYSITLAELSDTESLQLIKVYLQGYLPQWFIDVLDCFFRIAKKLDFKFKVRTAEQRFSRKALKAYRSWVINKVIER